MSTESSSEYSQPIQNFDNFENQLNFSKPRLQDKHIIIRSDDEFDSEYQEQPLITGKEYLNKILKSTVDMNNDFVDSMYEEKSDFTDDTSYSSNTMELEMIDQSKGKGKQMKNSNCKIDTRPAQYTSNVDDECLKNYDASYDTSCQPIQMLCNPQVTFPLSQMSSHSIPFNSVPIICVPECYVPQHLSNTSNSNKYSPSQVSFIPTNYIKGYFIPLNTKKTSKNLFKNGISRLKRFFTLKRRKHWGCNNSAPDTSRVPGKSSLPRRPEIPISVEKLGRSRMPGKSNLPRRPEMPNSAEKSGRLRMPGKSNLPRRPEMPTSAKKSGRSGALAALKMRLEPAKSRLNIPKILNRSEAQPVDTAKPNSAAKSEKDLGESKDSEVGESTKTVHCLPGKPISEAKNKDKINEEQLKAIKEGQLCNVPFAALPLNCHDPNSQNRCRVPYAFLPLPGHEGDQKDETGQNRVPCGVPYTVVPLSEPALDKEACGAPFGVFPLTSKVRYPMNTAKPYPSFIMTTGHHGPHNPEPKKESKDRRRIRGHRCLRRRDICNTDSESTDSSTDDSCMAEFLQDVEKKLVCKLNLQELFMKELDSQKDNLLTEAPCSSCNPHENRKSSCPVNLYSPAHRRCLLSSHNLHCGDTPDVEDRLSIMSKQLEKVNQLCNDRSNKITEYYKNQGRQNDLENRLEKELFS